MHINSINFTTYNSNFKSNIHKSNPDLSKYSDETHPEKLDRSYYNISSRKLYGFDKKTTTTLYSTSDNQLDTLSTKMKSIFDKHHVDPKNDLFIVSGLAGNKKRYVAFNTFHFDNESGQNRMQFFYLESENSSLTLTQLNALRVFHDKSNIDKFKVNSTNNPLAKFDARLKTKDSTFDKDLEDLATHSYVVSDNELMDEDGTVYPIIYTNDGKYARYKVVDLPNNRLFTNAEILKYIV